MARNGWYDPLIQYQAYYNFTVWPGNTYDYSPFNASVQAQFYNNLYGKGNCVDQIKDCAARGIDEICESAVSFVPLYSCDESHKFVGCVLRQSGREHI
jgi:carboxypeptidase D